VPDAALINRITEDVEKEHRDAFEKFRARHKIPPERAHLERGAAHERLPAVTESEAAGMLVMGAVSRRGLDKVFIGSTAERVLERLPCDVLIVKHGE